VGLLSLAALSVAADAPTFRPGVPTGAAALFVETDQALRAGDMERFASHYDDRFLSLPLGQGKRTTMARLARLLGLAPSSIETSILGGGTLGESVLVSADHRMVVEGEERVAHRVYLLRRAQEGYRIVVSVVVPESDRFEMTGSRVEAPHIGLHLRPPAGWMRFRTRGSYLEQELLLSPGLDTWVTLGVADTGGFGPRAAAGKETDLLRTLLRGVELLEEKALRQAGIDGWRTRFRFPAPPGQETRIAERIHLVREELAWVLWCSSTRGDPVATCDAALGPMLASLGHDPLPGHALDRFLEEHATGRVHGQRFECERPAVRFTAPRGWRIRARGADMPYLVGMSAPSGRQELLAGAFPLMGDGEATVRAIARFSLGETEPELEPLEVGGKPGWRTLQRIGETDHLTVYVPDGDALHFFSLQPAEPGGMDVLGPFLRSVRFDAP
jgi:hypothetical protein